MPDCRYTPSLNRNTSCWQPGHERAAEMNSGPENQQAIRKMLKQASLKRPTPSLPPQKMETSSVKWAPREYSLKEFVRKFETSFPAIIKITEGYLGKQEVDSISSSTVLRVHSLYYQKRAIATSSTGKVFSLPIKLRTLQFFVGNSILPSERYTKAARYLEELLSNNNLPLTIVSSTALSFKEKTSSGANQHPLNVLTVSETYEEHFLLGHPVEKGNIQIETPIVIPMYMKDIKLVMAEGYLNENSEKWTHICKHFDRKVQAEGLLEHFMVEEIFLLDRNDVSRKENTYDEIDRIYIDIHSIEFQKQIAPPKAAPEPVEEYTTTINTTAEYTTPINTTAEYTTPINTSNFPEDLHNLDMQEVCDCLQLLNMGQYTAAFQKEQIDGQLLFELKEEIMESCLGMNKLHIVKLLKFRDGWRPNTSNRTCND
ncbi:uncharacterized protein [Ambystoma mexicanum]|uniref:uncharacterized protein n=1 Tax=Ambystoma mexicanum TaxID=8296 RepID=UPI0037E854B2